MAGCVVTVNEADELVVPPAVVTVIGPLVAPLGTLVEICESLEVVTVAAVPP
ncbi:MAG: hypothetical protein JF886_15665 [Candidatus Dormibacteraeota bacterium]|uniref:Uncharacterized protein n=1 Tax=Candidatus Aeolococcus gillhamiae TaxID=3127015 RepID=A0A934K5T3_9BACT|nr:hypothetical protein [Candidatus Dormibacteraeota bacterium]